MLPYLPNGHQVILEGFGHTIDFWNNQKPAGTHLITTFFATGTVDDSRFEPQPIDMTPANTQTALAKRIAAAMVGGALLAALSWPSPRGACVAVDVSGASPASRCARCSLSCSASAAGSAPRCSP